MNKLFAGLVLAATLPVSASNGADATPPAPDAAPTKLDPITVIGHPIPKPRLRLAPHYPMDAKKRWEEGCVVLQFTVRPDGKTDDFAILESKPIGVFERSVIGAVYRWQYDPSPEPRTVVELFEFRNQSLSTQPMYTMRSAVKVPTGNYDSNGARRYKLETQLQGYQPPKCTTG